MHCEDCLEVGECDLFEHIFDSLVANVVRSRSTITAVFMGEQADGSSAAADIDASRRFLSSMIRKGDFLIKLPDEHQWLILLVRSGEKEATAFLNRIYESAGADISFSSCVAEISDGGVSYRDLREQGQYALEDNLCQGRWHIQYLENFKRKDKEMVRISVLEENGIFRQVLLKTLRDLDLDYFEADIKTFPDGYEFLQSNWFNSSHMHIVIMSDILPKQNGLEVLHRLRALPNTKRIVVYMMTKRKSEEDMIYAYESGVDNYLVKPFSLRLFEAQIMRTFERMWS